MPRKVRELISDLERAGFSAVVSAGKGSHRKFVHLRYPDALTISGRTSTDVKAY